MQDCYTVTSYTVENFVNLITSGDIAIPEIQRPFVWDSTKVRDLIDSLYHGYPTGYLITWKNPDVKIKGGGTSEGKTVLIDGQQRITALMTAIAGMAVLNEDYETRRVTISFNPIYPPESEDTPFAVLNAAIKKDSKWIEDISVFFKADFDSWSFVNEYIERNPGCDPRLVNARINDLKGIATRQLGCIVVNADCTIDEVTDIFIRINSQGVVLSQADFAMSKIAADETHGGSMLRKAIDYYCRLAVKPEFWATISANDKAFMASEYAAKSEWLKDDRDDVYDPTYTDVLRVAFMHKFKRAVLSVLVALLSGRDFEARTYRSEIADDSFARLKDGVLKFMYRGNFQDFTTALRSAGFVSRAALNYSQNAVSFAYNLYLTLREDPSVPATDVKRWVARWFVMSLLTGRYSSSPESMMDGDIRGIAERGFRATWEEIEASQLSDNYWDVVLPQQLARANRSSVAWVVYVASQIRASDNTLFSSGFKVADIVNNIGDIHHIFPRDYLRREIGATQRVYNQVANYAYLEKRINIAIGAKGPADYFGTALSCCRDGGHYFGDISNEEELRRNLRANCIPEGIFAMSAEDYDDFLAQRRSLMAKKIREYFYSL